MTTASSPSIPSRRNDVEGAVILRWVSEFAWRTEDARTPLYGVVLDNATGRTHIAYNAEQLREGEALVTTYRAGKNKSQGRDGWCVIFSHPLRRDDRGKPLRVRRGLGTKDDAEADLLVEQMDRLLADRSYWTPAAHDRAIRDGIDARIAAIFFDDIDPTTADAWSSRDSAIPIPGRDQGFVKVQLLGPTGAGKTTLLRQLIGTDPVTERFPSTSTAKTTIFDIEIVCMDGPYRAVVSFHGRDRTRAYVEDCVVAAVSAVGEEAEATVVARRFLEHHEQRFRLSYLLGTTVTEGTDEDDDLENGDEETRLSAVSEIDEVERKQLADRLQAYLARITQIGEAARTRLGDVFDIPAEGLRPTDRDAFLELLEELLRDDGDLHALVDDVFDDVESRFKYLEVGALERDRSGWPTQWTDESNERSDFIRTINRFSSNYAPHFGRLLTPLVQGMRVAGPFVPDWYHKADIPRIVFMDGEGVGHTPESAASLSTAVTKRYERSDLILLVDNAMQPMVAGPIALLRSLSSSGHEEKLAVVFTHFDQVRGDNLPNRKAKQDHVFASLENALRGVGDALGAGVARSLRRNLNKRVFFVSDIDAAISSKNRATLAELKGLVDVIAAAISPAPLITAVPVYDLANLVLAANGAAAQFHESWETRLPGEHWTRIKALARRLGFFQQDEYDTLRPAADLIRFITEQVWRFIESPRSWEPAAPSEEERQLAVNQIAREFFSRLHVLVPERLMHKQLQEWQSAYDLRGAGSGNRRKDSVRFIYNAAARVSGAFPVPEAADFLDSIRSVFRQSAEAAGAKVA